MKLRTREERRRGKRLPFSSFFGSEEDNNNDDEIVDYDDEIEEIDDDIEEDVGFKSQLSGTMAKNQKRRDETRRKPSQNDIEEVTKKTSNTRRKPSQDVQDDIEKDEEEDDGPINTRKRPLTEISEIGEIETAVKINSVYLETLIKAAQYMRGNPMSIPQLAEIDQSIIDTLKTLGTMCPVTQTKPVVRAVPPTIPQADGTEVRFTAVAFDKGIRWSLVPDDAKKIVYDRAANLHKEIYGSWPKKVNMWTYAGFKPVSYYNSDTYRPTMARALDEYKEGKLGISFPDVFLA